jgi:ABC-2 type transport system permease protein
VSSQGARLFGLGYRSYEGPRRSPRWAIVALGVFTVRRVLGLGRGTRHKILPALVLLIAFAPALVSVAVAALLNDIESDQLISYGEYTFIIGSALALFAALIAPEALCPDRRSGLLGLYLAGPLDRNRYLLAKGGAVYLVMLATSLCPLLFMYLAFVVAGFGPSASATPKLIVQILASGLATGIAYAALSLAAASFTTRRAVAAVAVILLLLVPDIAARAAIEDGGAPDALSLLGMPAVVYELSSRIFGEAKPGDTPITRVSTELLLAGFFAWTGLSAAVCWLRYRRIEAFR